MQNCVQVNFVFVQVNGVESDGYFVFVFVFGILLLLKLMIVVLLKWLLLFVFGLLVDVIVLDVIVCWFDLQGVFVVEKVNCVKIKVVEVVFMLKIFLFVLMLYVSGGMVIFVLFVIGDQVLIVNLNGSCYGGGVFFGVMILLYDGGLCLVVLMQVCNDV